jgi:hypothetical protein
VPAHDHEQRKKRQVLLNNLCRIVSKHAAIQYKSGLLVVMTNSGHNRVRFVCSIRLMCKLDFDRVSMLGEHSIESLPNIQQSESLILPKVSPARTANLI